MSAHDQRGMWRAERKRLRRVIRDAFREGRIYVSLHTSKPEAPTYG